MDGLYEQFRIALHSIWVRRWLALAVAWALCLVGWLVVALIPNTYESKAKVFAQMQTILPDKIGITAAERQADMLRVKQVLMSTENLQKVVRRTELNQLVVSDRDLTAQVNALRETIRITAQQDNLFEIAATSGVRGFSNSQNAKTASAVVQNLLDLFVEENLAGNRTETGQTLTFLDGELKRREAQLQEAEQRRTQFEQQFLGMLPGDGTVSQRMSAARTELTGLEQQLISAQGSLNSLRAQMSATPANIAVQGYVGPQQPVMMGVSGQLAALEAQLGQAQARGWTNNHPDVITLKAEIARLKPQAAREGRRGGGVPPGMMTSPNPAYTSLRAMAAEKEAQVAALTMRKNQLEQGVAQIVEKQNSDPAVVAEQTRVNRDYEVLKRQYDKLLEDREQIRLRSDVQTKTDSINFKVLDPPSRPTVPVSPNRPMLLTLILFASAAIGLGAAFVKGQLQTTFPTQNRLEQVSGLPVLGSVSEFFTAERKARERQRLKWLVGAGGALAASYGLLLIVEFWQRSTVA